MVDVLKQNALQLKYNHDILQSLWIYYTVDTVFLSSPETDWIYCSISARLFSSYYIKCAFYKDHKSVF